ncbi:hypothetical protein ACVPOR_16700 [Staphylococcus aureus]
MHKVTIVPRGQAGGYAMMLPKQDRFLMTEQELLDKILWFTWWTCIRRY